MGKYIKTSLRKSYSVGGREVAVNIFNKYPKSNAELKATHFN